ncbi:MAG: hypothetical protein L0Z53_24125 [Acidobacteriales bacterium]|nr:hypothetical protein [Terriglobales bacterium]
MNLLNPPTYDEKREKRRKKIIAATVFVLLVAAFLAWHFRYWPEERVVNKFFDRLEAKDFESAYGIWMADPNWKQHPEKHTRYPYNEFYLDWGPGGEYGPIKSHDISNSISPRASGGGSSSSGVIVDVTVNGRAEPARLWVEKSDKSLTFSPY